MIKTFERKKVVGLNTKGRLFLAVITLLLTIFILWLMNPRAIDTRGNKSVTLQEAVIQLCVNK